MQSRARGLREERRVVTALFADLVGSTEIGERLDPEDARDVVGGAIERIIAVVDDLGGTIKDIAGDGVLALYGAPVAHEDDAERAVLAGLRIAEAVRAYADDARQHWELEGFGVRVGIESGLAVVGAVGGGSHVEYGAVGDVVNSAARLQANAEPGTVLVGEATRSTTEPLFEWGPMRSLEVKGKRDLVRASVAVRQAVLGQARVKPTRTVGRVAELAVVADAVAALDEGRGTLLLISGHAGVGKSRLLDECRALLTARRGRDATAAWLEGHCRSYADATPYALYQDLVCRWLGIRPDDAPARKRDALTAALSAVDDSVDRDALLRDVLGVDDRVDALEPSERQRRAFASVLALVRAVAAEARGAVALEDLHWADPTSLLLTGQLLALTDAEPLLVIATRRAEEDDASARLFEAAAVTHSRRLRIEPLPAGSDRALLHSLLGDALPANVERSILEASDGNPFFLEQQVKALIDAGAVERWSGGWRFLGSRSLEVPETIEKVILSRLDRLEPAPREALVAASVLGRGFQASVLEAIVGDTSTLPADLAALVHAGLLDRFGPPESGDYRFAHAVIQETAYRSLLRRARRVLHARAAAAMERLTAADQLAATIGHHFAEAGDIDRAIPYFVKAGNRAKAAYANAEAIASYERVLALLADATVDADDRPALQADVLAQLGDVLRLVARHDEARAAFERARESAREDAIRSARIELQIGRVEDELHRYEQALERWAAAEHELARVPEDAPGRWDAWFDIQDHKLTTLYWLGDTAAIDALVERIRPTVDARATTAQRGEFFGRLAQARLRRNQYVADAEAVGFARAAFAAVLEDGKPDAIAWERFALGFVLVFAEDLDEAQALLEQALSDAGRMGDARLRSRCLAYLLVIARKRGDLDRVARDLDAVVEAARAARLPEYEALAVANAAWVAWRGGDPDAALQRGEAALDQWRSLPVRYWYDWMALWPMVAIAADRGEMAVAIDRLHAMRVDPQQPLPADLAVAVDEAVEAWSTRNGHVADELVAHAVDLARQLSYL